MLTLTSILSTPESSYLEGKSAKGGFPDSFWESYSAFANIRFGERAGSGLNGIMYVWEKVFHTSPEIFVKEEYDRTFLKLPTLGREPDVEALMELYPDEETSDKQAENIDTVDKTSDKQAINSETSDKRAVNDPVNDTVNDPVNENDLVNGTLNDPINENDPVNVTVNDPINENGTLNGTLNAPINENDTLNCTLNDPTNENGTLKSQIIEIIRVNPNVNAIQLTKLLNKSLRQIRRFLAELQKSVTIRRIGADKNGHWEVINNQSVK